MSKFKSLTVLPLLLVSSGLKAQTTPTTVNDTYASGELSDITSVKGALLVRFADNKAPSNCSGAGFGWLRIDQADTAMISLTLTYWTQRIRRFTVYTTGSSSGYCDVGQMDPAN